MKKNNFRLFITLTLIFLGIFSLFFISNKKVFAQLQVIDDISVQTAGSSVLGPDSFVFRGYYSGNYSHRGFTTYFEFKKGTSGGSVINIDLNDLLNSGQQTTQKIVRKGVTKEANDFFISAELNSPSFYYFRAVGYFNDNPDQKFYGSVSSISTDFPASTVTPFSVTGDGTITDFVTPNSDADIISTGETGDQTICPLPSLLDKNTGLCETEVCYKPEKLNYETGHCVLPIPDDVDPNNPNNPNNGGNTGNGIRYNDFDEGLVVCKSANCGFNDLMFLINRVVNYALFVLFIPIAAILFAYAGVMMLTSGGEVGKKKKALSVFWNVGLGLIIAVSSWLIVKTILSIVGLKDAFRLFF